MDHLWLDKKGQHEPEPVRVPNLFKYDGGDWQGFPRRLELEDNFYTTVIPDFRHDPSEVPYICISQAQFVSLLQEWLFLGLLVEFFRICGKETHRQDFIKLRDGREVLCTANLWSLFEQVLEAQADGILPMTPDLEKELTYVILRRELLKNNNHSYLVSRTGVDAIYCVEMSDATRRSLCLLERHDRAAESKKEDEDFQMTYSSLRAMIETTTHFLADAANHFDKMELWLSIFESNFTACVVMCSTLSNFADVLHRRNPMLLQLSIATWTPHIQNYVRRPLKCRRMPIVFSEATALYVGSSLNRFPSVDHHYCKPGACLLMQQDFSDLPKHATHCDGLCEMIPLSSEGQTSLARCLDEGSFGVLQLQPAAKNGHGLRVVDHRQCEGGYIAFSHVWAHGLGNPNANALPQCQIHRLLGLTGELTSSGASAFWLDTLLVPLVEPQRRQTIARMGDIYRKSKATIVVDIDLLSYEGPEMLRRMHLQLCDWMTRLWTLQEAVLSWNKLYIAFAERLLSLYELTEGATYNRSLQDQIIDPGKSAMLITEFTTNSQEPNLLSLANVIKERTTTRKSDEAICLATLLRVDVNLLPREPKLEDLLALLGQIPQGLAFISGQRCESKGFRWAPRTLLDRPDTPPVWAIGPSQHLAPIGSKGILLSRGILRLEGAVLYDSACPALSVKIQAIAAAAEHLTFRVAMEIGSYPGQKGSCNLKVVNSAAIVISLDYKDGLFAREKSSDSKNLLSFSSAILVGELKEGEDGTLCARYEKKVNVYTDDGMKGGKIVLPELSEARHLNGTLAPDLKIWVD